MKAGLISVREVRPEDLSWVLEVIQEQWGGDFVVVHKQIFYPHQLPGYLAEDQLGSRIGLITYQIQQDRLEIITLNSLEEGRGIGSALIAAVMRQARDGQCTGVRVTTTNDNAGAIDFYQRRGYTLREIRKGAVDLARTIKPSIPDFSEDGTAISDEIEFEFLIQ